LNVDHSRSTVPSKTQIRRYHPNSVSSHIYERYSIFVDFQHKGWLYTSIRLRTTLIDEATGHAIYQIDTPKKRTRSVTRIRKFHSPIQHHHHWDDDGDSSCRDGITDEEKLMFMEDKNGKEGDEEVGAEFPETSDEIARI